MKNKFCIFLFIVIQIPKNNKKQRPKIHKQLFVLGIDNMFKIVYNYIVDVRRNTQWLVRLLIKKQITIKN